MWSLSPPSFDLGCSFFIQILKNELQFCEIKFVRIFYEWAKKLHFFQTSFRHPSLFHEDTLSGEGAFFLFLVCMSKVCRSIFFDPISNFGIKHCFLIFGYHSTKRRFVPDFALNCVIGILVLTFLDSVLVKNILGFFCFISSSASLLYSPFPFPFFPFYSKIYTTYFAALDFNRRSLCQIRLFIFK